MKKIFLILSAVAALVSCSSNDNEIETSKETGYHYSIISRLENDYTFAISGKVYSFDGVFISEEYDGTTANDPDKMTIISSCSIDGIISSFNFTMDYSVVEAGKGEVKLTNEENNWNNLSAFADSVIINKKTGEVFIQTEDYIFLCNDMIKTSSAIYGSSIPYGILDFDKGTTYQDQIYYEPGVKDVFLFLPDVGYFGGHVNFTATDGKNFYLDFYNRDGSAACLTLYASEFETSSGALKLGQMELCNGTAHVTIRDERKTFSYDTPVTQFDINLNNNGGIRFANASGDSLHMNIQIFK